VLARHPDPRVRLAVACDDLADHGLLAAFAHDPNNILRMVALESSVVIFLKCVLSAGADLSDATCVRDADFGERRAHVRFRRALELLTAAPPVAADAFDAIGDDVLRARRTWPVRPAAIVDRLPAVRQAGFLAQWCTSASEIGSRRAAQLTATWLRTGRTVQGKHALPREGERRVDRQRLLVGALAARMATPTLTSDGRHRVIDAIAHYGSRRVDQ